MEKMVLSSLVKVFSDEKPAAKEISGFSMLKNERTSFQLAVLPNEDIAASVEVSGIDGKNVKVYSVRDVPVGLACNKDADDYFLRKTSGNYPDVLERIGGGISLKKDRWQSVWIEINPKGEISGDFEVTVSLTACGKTLVSGAVTVEIIDAELPKQTLINTHWYHADCLCNYYKVEAFSQEFWRINENFVKTAVRYGINFILVPLFTPPLDTMVGGERLTIQLVGVKFSGAKYIFDFSRLTEWLDMCDRCGVQYFEMSHLFTQWGAKHAPKIIATDVKGRKKKIFGWKTRTSSKKYDEFLRQFAAALIKFIDRRGIRERCFFHVSDEPNMRQLATYKRRADYLHSLFPGFTFIDALSEYEFYEKGAVQQPIPNCEAIEDFVGRVPELWTYYCCGPYKDTLPNRFIAMPSQRNRVLGYLMYAYDVKGFLQWGYNYYYTRLSLRSVDPYKETDAGGAFSAGDAFVVYPGKNGEALPSLRLKVFYDGLQDMRALQLLESLTSRENALSVLKNGLESELKFTQYPCSDEWHLETRRRINAEIKKNIK